MFALSPWLQLPIVLAVALPAAGLAAWAMLRVADWLAFLRDRTRGAKSAQETGSAHGEVSAAADGEVH